MLNSPSTPPSSTSTRTSATVDGSNRPIEDTRPLRSVEAIRSDLEHPHTAALTALHSTTIGDGPIGRLLRDVAPLLDRLAAVERERDAYKRSATAAWEAHEGVSEMYTETESELDAALARIAAVEALPAAGASVRRKSLDETVNGVDPMSFKYGWLRAIEHVRAALAASPTPTGPETCEHGQTEGHSFYVAENRDWNHSAEYATCPGPATPEPTEETP